MEKIKVLVFVRYYLPGFKSGGPVRTIANLVEHLGEDFNFRIITSDRDDTDSTPYSNITIGEWNRVGNALVYYLSPEERSFTNIIRLIRQTKHDVLYLNSFFDPVFTIMPLLGRWLGMIPDTPVVLAPRGEFSQSAYSLGKWKKRPYKFLSTRLGLYNDITWQASSKHEAKDIRKALNFDPSITIAPNLPPVTFDTLEKNKEGENIQKDCLKICFLSRITPMKNLDYALHILNKVNEEVLFDIYGPIGDEGYWSKCKKLISELPENIKAAYKGAVEHKEVRRTIAAYDLFFLPTLGENYGHVITEALSVGTPLLISDNTPWRNLEEKNVGWDISLDRPELFVQAINNAAKTNDRDYLNWRREVLNHAEELLNNSSIVNVNRELFKQLVR